MGDDIHYLNEKGKEIYTVKNGEPDKTFIIKTTKTQSDVYTQSEIDNGNAGATINTISKADAKMTEQEIGKGNLTGNHMNNVVEIENIPTLKEMYNVVKKDNGNGGTGDANNREYGGVVGSDGKVTEATPGEVRNPQTQSADEINLTTKNSDRAEFHSHGSGDITQTSGGINKQTQIFNWVQGPSKTDINAVEKRTGYVFARRDGVVYIYNSTGVVASLPSKILK